MVTGRCGRCQFKLAMRSRPSEDWRATALFYAVACSISWAAWLALFKLGLSHLSGAGLGLYVVAVLAPHISAITVTAANGGRPGLQEFYGLVFRRASITWIAIAITVPVIISLIPYLLAVCVRQSHDPPFHPPQRTLPMLALGRTVVAIGEEPGWRGFALPRLTRQLGRIGGTLVLGAAWAVWHTLLFIIPGTAQFGTPFVPFLILLTAWSLIMTLMVEHAHGSVLVAMLFHASANVCDFTVWQPADPLSAMAPWVGAALIASYLMRHSALSKL